MSSRDTAEPASKKACVTKLVPAPAPGCGVDPGAVGKGPSNNRALSVASTQCHAPVSSISQALFRAGGRPAASIASLYLYLTVLLLSFECPPTSARISGLLTRLAPLLQVSRCPALSLAMAEGASVSVSVCVSPPLCLFLYIFLCISVFPLDFPSLR